MLTLKDARINSRVRILEIRGKVRFKLLRYGLHVGDLVRVMRQAPLGGPLLIEVNSREMAIGREIAEKIIVEAG